MSKNMNKRTDNLGGTSEKNRINRSALSMESSGNLHKFNLGASFSKWSCDNCVQDNCACKRCALINAKTKSVILKERAGLNMRKLSLSLELVVTC